MSVDVNRCIAYSVTKGKPILKRDLAKRLWPDSKPKTQGLNLLNLIHGRTERIDPEWVQIICTECGVDANYLFNIKAMSDE